MEYFLAKTSLIVDNDITSLTQLVKASNKVNAKQAVENYIQRHHADDVVIIEIKIYDTIIGE